MKIKIYAAFVALHLNEHLVTVDGKRGHISYDNKTTTGSFSCTGDFTDAEFKAIGKTFNKMMGTTFQNVGFLDFSEGKYNYRLVSIYK